MPASILSSVDLPEPFWPISPNVVPRSMLNVTSRSAQNSSWRPPPRTKRSLSESRRSVASLNILDRSATSIAISVTANSHLLRKVAPEPAEHPDAEGDRHRRRPDDVQPAGPAPRRQAVREVAEQFDELAQRVAHQDAVSDRARDQGVLVEDGCRVEQQLQAYGDDMRQVAEVDVRDRQYERHGGDEPAEHRSPERQQQPRPADVGE